MTTNQVAHEQANANDVASDQAARPMQKESRAISYLTNMLASADNKKDQLRAVAGTLRSHPEWQHEIAAWINAQPGFGNSFMSEVMAEVREISAENRASAMRDFADENRAVGVAPGERGGASKARADEALADARELDPPAPKATANDPAPAAAEASKNAAPAAAESKPQTAAAEQAPVAAPPSPEAKQEVAPPAKNDPEPAAQGPAPAPDSAAAKNAEPAPEVANQPAPPAPAAAGPEAAPKPEDKAAVEQGKEEKPEEKANGKVKVTASALRVRAAASLNGQILGKLPRGKEVDVEGHEGAWLRITWEGKPAFIHSKYTTAVKGNEGGEEEEQGEQDSQEQKQERPKAPPVPTNESQQNERV